MGLTFIEKGHKYESSDGIVWTSVTSFISMFKDGFDKKGVAKKCSTNLKASLK